MDHTRVVADEPALRDDPVHRVRGDVSSWAWFWAYFNVSLFPAAPLEFLRTDFTGGHWPPKGVSTLDAFHLPLFNTLILLTSGTTITWAPSWPAA